MLHGKDNGIYYYFYEEFINAEEDPGLLDVDFNQVIYFYDLPLIDAFPLFDQPPELRKLLRYLTHSQFQEKMGVQSTEADTAVEWAWGLSEEEQTK